MIERTVTEAWPRASTLPGVTVWPGSSGKLGPTSRNPRMSGDSACQSWTEEVPSSLILLPDRESRRVIGSAARADVTAARKMASVGIRLLKVSLEFIVCFAISGGLTFKRLAQFVHFRFQLDTFATNNRLVGFDTEDSGLKSFHRTGDRVQPLPRG